MSVKVKIETLNESQVKNIQKHLVFTPTNNAFSFKPGAAQLPSIVFYSFNTETGELRIPFWYGKILLKLPHTSEAPKISEQTPNINIEWRYWQPSIVEEARLMLSNRNACLLALPPGAGKTVISTILSYEYNELVLILIPNKGLIKQWANTITEHTIYAFIVHPTNKKLLSPKSKLAMERKQLGFIIYTPRTCYQIPQELLDRVGTLIVDEAHRFCTPESVNGLLCTTPRRVILCSATPYTSNKMEIMLHCLVSKQMIERAPLHPYTVFIIKTEWLLEEKKQRGYFGESRVSFANFDKLEKINIASARTVALFVYLLYQLWKAGKKVIAISRYKSLIKILEQRLTNKKIPFSTYYEDQTTYQEAPILMATMKKAGEGFDESSFCDNFSGKTFDVVVLLSSIKFPGALFQVLGRGLRSENAELYGVLHSNKTYQNHHKENCRLFNKTNGIIKYIELEPPVRQALNKIPL